MRSIPGYENYSINEDGVIFNKKNKIMKPSINGHGYCVVNLYKDKQKRMFSIHQLMFMVFYGIESDRKNVIDHIDGNKTNNKLSNLQYVTQRLNTTKDRKSKTGLTGVYEYKGRFQSAIRVNGKKIHLGTFETAEKAYDAYKKELKNLELYPVIY